MEKVNFNLMNLLIEDPKSISRFELPEACFFEKLPLRGCVSNQDAYYEVKVERTDEYCWFYFNYGKASPRCDTVTNIETGLKKNNLRQHDEAELLGQIFALFHYKKRILYFSDMRKKKVFESFIRENTMCDVVVKAFFLSAEEMIEKLKKVDRIRFTNSRDLFSDDASARQALIDLTGTDAPEEFKLEASYDGNSISNFIRKLFKQRREQKISDLVICGRDEDDFKFVYNEESFSRKIEVDAPRTVENLFDVESVKIGLLKEVCDARA